jgi:hypothetical protein
MKETRPFTFFGAISGGFLLTSLIFMAPVLVAYFETGLVERMPTWVFSLVLMMISFLVFSAGMILDSLARARAEQLRIHYMNLPAGHAGHRHRAPAARHAAERPRAA